jgi:hypothetical protein
VVAIKTKGAATSAATTPFQARLPRAFSLSVFIIVPSYIEESNFALELVLR